MKMLQDLDPEQRNKLYALQATIDYHKRALGRIDYTEDPETFLGYMHRFWEFISSYEDEETFAYFEHSEYYQHHRNFFTSIDYSRIMETLEALNFMAQPTVEHQTFLDKFDRKLEEEMSMIDWRWKRNIVMVGSGPLPVTLLYLHKRTNAKQIIGLDSNQESVFIAGQVIRRMDKDMSRIQLLHYNGLNYDYSDADFVFVANCVRPKSKILNRIAETVKHRALIMVRSPISFGKMIFDNALDGLNPRLTLTQVGKADNYFLERVVVLQKLDI